MRIPFLPLFYILCSALLTNAFPLQAQQEIYSLKLNTLVAKELPLAQLKADSLKARLQKVGEDTGKIELYGQLCYIYANTIGDVVLAHRYADSIQLVAEKLNHKSYLAASDYYYGMVARHECKYAEALHYWKNR